MVAGRMNVSIGMVRVYVSPLLPRINCFAPLRNWVCQIGTKTQFICHYVVPPGTGPAPGAPRGPANSVPGPALGQIILRQIGTGTGRRGGGAPRGTHYVVPGRAPGQGWGIGHGHRPTGHGAGVVWAQRGHGAGAARVWCGCGGSIPAPGGAGGSTGSAPGQVAPPIQKIRPRNYIRTQKKPPGRIKAIKDELSLFGVGFRLFRSDLSGFRPILSECGFLIFRSDLRIGHLTSESRGLE